MDDLISRQAVIDTVKYDYFTAYTQIERVNEVKAIPAADVVPVVRCKECRNSEYDFVTQIRGCSWFRIPVTDDFFCAKGERKE